MAHDDLKCEMLEIKKQLQNAYAENGLLKVKIRKLQNENNKKNKQIETLLDPRKSINIRKIVSERGALMIVNLKQQNEQLVEAVQAKDMLIKRLQAEIQMSKVYATKEKQARSKSPVQKNYQFLELPTENKAEQYITSRSVSPTPRPSMYLKNITDKVKAVEHARLTQNLEKIKQASSFVQGEQHLSGENMRTLIETFKKNSNNYNSSPESIQNMTDVQESQNVHYYLSSMLIEMDTLKQTIQNLSSEQKHTKQLLDHKNYSIENMARQIKDLQQPVSAKKVKNFVLNRRVPSYIRYYKKIKPFTKKYDQNDDNYSEDTFEEDIQEPSPVNSKTNHLNIKSSNKLSAISSNQTIETDSNYPRSSCEESNDDDDVETGD